MTTRIPKTSSKALADPKSAISPIAGSKRRDQTEQVYGALKRMILENELQAGSFFLQEELAQQLGVSRTPVREALIRLAADGLIEVRPRHGMRVLPVSITAMREIYEVLTALEALAAKLAAERGADADRLAALEAAVADMEASLASDDRAAWADADDRFHRTLVEASANQRLIDMITLVTDQAYRVRKLTLRLRPQPTASNTAHRAVVAAIRARDPATAHAIHERHRAESGNMLIELLKQLDIRET